MTYQDWYKCWGCCLGRWLWGNCCLLIRLLCF